METLFRAHPVRIPIMDSEAEGDSVEEEEEDLVAEDRRDLDRGEIIITEMISIDGDEGDIDCRMRKVYLYTMKSRHRIQ